MSSVGRKLPREYENPFDNVFTDLAERANPYFYRLRLIPNHITCLSALFGVASSYFLAQQHFYAAPMLFMISYFFDVADGNYARTYKMVSDLGDILDHSKDVLVVVSLYWVILFHLTLPMWMCVAFFSGQGIMLTGMCMYIAAQESYYEKAHGKNSESKSLRILRKVSIAPNLSTIRWFGCGSHAVFTSFFMVVFSTAPNFVGKD